MAAPTLKQKQQTDKFVLDQVGNKCYNQDLTPDWWSYSWYTSNAHSTHTKTQFELAYQISNRNTMGKCLDLPKGFQIM